MASTGLLAVFALTVGLSTLATLAAQALYRDGRGSFAAALRTALLGVGALALVGIVGWSVASDGSLRDGAAVLLLAVLAAALALLVGRRLVGSAWGVDAETALRFATYGWPVAMTAVFGVAVGYRRLTRDLYHPGSAQICVLDTCTGITVALAAATLAAALTAVFGPGLAGLALYASANKRSVDSA